MNNQTSVLNMSKYQTTDILGHLKCEDYILDVSR